MKQQFHTYIQWLGILGVLFCLTQCDTYEPIVNIKIVNKKDPTQSIAGAKVSLQGKTVTTDTNGIAWLDIQLDRFILDRVEVTASAKGYRDSIGNILVGKDQQETIIIPLEPLY